MKTLFLLTTAGLLFLIAIACAAPGNNSSIADEEEILPALSSPAPGQRDKAGLLYYSQAALRPYSSKSELLFDLAALGNIQFDKAVAEEIKKGITIAPVIPEIITNDGGVANSLTNDAGTVTPPADVVVSSATRGSDFETNNQVAGVDEGDILKTDGTYIYIAEENSIVSMNTAGVLLGRVPCTGVSQILISDKNLYALGSGTLSRYQRKSDGTLRYLEEKFIENSTYTSNNFRKNNDSVILVAGRSLYFNILPIMSALNRSHPEYQTLSDELYRERAEALRTQIVSNFQQLFIKNTFYKDIETLRDEDLKDFMPLTNFSFLSPNTESDDEHPGYLPDSIIDLYSFPLDKVFSTASSVHQFSMGSSYDIPVYLNQNRAIIAQRGYSWWRTNSNPLAGDTLITTFQLNADGIIPEAAGRVEGMVDKQFNMDIHEGILRVSSCIQPRPWWWSWWNSDNSRAPRTAESLVTTFRFNDRSLEQIGQVRGIGIGENLFASRFDGDKAYLVTFRQIDPFFVIDLSDPQQPAIAGELHLPGFSTYLHPIDNDRVLAVGQGGSGFKLSLFDVSDSAHPQESDNILSSNYGYSPASWDHHAFRYISQRETLVLPVNTYDASTYHYYTHFKIIHIEEDQSLSEEGEIIPTGEQTNYSYSFYRNFLIG